MLVENVVQVEGRAFRVRARGGDPAEAADHAGKVFTGQVQRVLLPLLFQLDFARGGLEGILIRFAGRVNPAGLEFDDFAPCIAPGPEGQLLVAGVAEILPRLVAPVVRLVLPGGPGPPRWPRRRSYRAGRG